MRERGAGSAGPQHPSASSRLPALGPEGEGWVMAQLGAYAAVALAGLRGRRWPPPARPLLKVGGVVAATAGGAMILGGAVGLERSLTPNPRPKKDGTLRKGGLYGLVRHPIYGGVILAALGWSLWRSPAALGPSALTVVVLDLKARREEAWLEERYPGYRDYRDRVSKRFLPRVW
jgi:protein-S-isoprenylcysteine O-methyltransferase Ste14